MVNLITGYRGKGHVTSANQGTFNAGVFGRESYVLDIGNTFAAEIITNNTIRIKDGALVLQGRQVNIDANTYEDVEIDNGVQSVKRNDLIVMRYTRSDDTNVEDANLVVIKGVSGDEGVDPDYTKGDIFAGEKTADFPLYRVKLNGINIESVESLYDVIGNMEKLGEKIEEQGSASGVSYNDTMSVKDALDNRCAYSFTNSINVTNLASGSSKDIIVDIQQSGTYLVAFSVAHCGASNISKAGAYWSVKSMNSDGRGNIRRSELAIPIANAWDNGVSSVVIQYLGKGTKTFTFTNYTGIATSPQYPSNITVYGIRLI